MDLEAPLLATHATGSRFGAGLWNLLRPGAFAGDPRIVFLEPFDPDKIPLVLVHGLLSTPRMWAPLVMDLLADEAIRLRYQIWFFYYPTGQPVPLSALQLREALDAAVAAHGPVKPMVLVGHSMGGILSRAQVSRVGLAEAEAVVPGVAHLPEDSRARRALVFEPRADVGRAVFLFTPHRGSRLASNSLGAWGVRLIRLPDALINEVGDLLETLAGQYGGRLPTSIHGLSPDSPFLRVLDDTKPVVPTHTILGDRGRGDLWTSSDGVVPYSSAHLPSAESEVVVPAGHGGFAHPDAVAELKRILKLDGAGARKPAAQKGRVRK
jgi:pimeloyl-ACP methyl ester carboxylesterase